LGDQITGLVRNQADEAPSDSVTTAVTIARIVGSLQAIAFSMVDRLLVTVGSDGAVRLWDLAEVLARDP
jgi:hypothetical protein